MPEDFWSRRIDIGCPHCQQAFKVRLRKLRFGADLVCMLGRHEFSAKRDSNLPEVKSALLQLQRLEGQWRAGSLRDESF